MTPTRCPICKKELPAAATFCPSCNASLVDSFSPTRKIDPDPPASDRQRPSRPPTSLESIDDARFIPGTMLTERYRIVGLLGKGGMGEVYRAEDLKLGQPVALKFLPDRLLSDAAALARFHREVRVARQVSHKNVCRVYDIGEVKGNHFLSMEYIKGEELSSLLRRIGRLPADKATQLARQICAGLAAAHESGVLHRDLKPSNVMIDGDGNARILDFGLAGLAEEFLDDEVTAGTPAYMAPEQLEGKGVTVRSDIYSLGLVLYELFTGKRAFEAGSLRELMELRRSDTSPTNPTSIVKDLDPSIERVIDRCLQKNPAQRPSSALQVAAALPGGDPIAAALAAGETPSPEMVAAAPREGALRPAVALTLFASLLLGLALITAFANKYVLYGYVPLEKSPEVLREQAREIIRKLGYQSPSTDDMHAFEFDSVPLAYIASTDARASRWKDLKDGQPAPIFYWYRQSPDYLGGFDYFKSAWTNPPAIISGMIGVRLDTRGRLLNFYAVPPQVDLVSSSEFRVSSPDSSPSVKDGVQSASELENRNPKLDTEVWSSLFALADLDIANFKPTVPKWAPLYVNDARAAWEGVYPEQATIPIRIEAASYRGKPVYFQIVNPWDKPERQEPFQYPPNFKFLFALLISVFGLVLVGSVMLAVRNLRLGRGDRKGAFRLALFVFTITLCSRLASAHHVPTLAEFGTMLNGLQDAVFFGVFFWVLYVALEPFVRKRWPGRIVSWTRLLAGDFRDPLVGRDVLIGSLFGVGTALWQLSFYFIRQLLSDSNLKPASEPANWQLGIGHLVPGFAGQLTTPLISSLQLLFFILLLALLFRRDWLAFFAGWLVCTAGLALLGGNTRFSWLSAAVTAGLFTFVLFRYGLLATCISLLYLHMYLQFPVTTHLTAWYASGFVVDLIIVVALGFYAFRTSLAGQRLFGGKLFADD